ncbi:hypothetical protein F5Y16DRAFT_399227 [Xylariaceae sp. FL0255]|nr:hypothetical protein F5Y16DRAFT_399227 [Xylariaceae sp. FL0255]
MALRATGLLAIFSAQATSLLLSSSMLTAEVGLQSDCGTARDDTSSSGLEMPPFWSAGAARRKDGPDAIMTTLQARSTSDSLLPTVTSSASVTAGIDHQVWSSLENRVKTYLTASTGGFPHLPTGQEVTNLLSPDSSVFEDTTIKVMNIPGYGNWTEDGWNARIHGYVYEQPNIDKSTLEELTNYLLDPIFSQTNTISRPTENEFATNVSGSIFVVPQPDVPVSVYFVDDSSINDTKSGGARPARGGVQDFDLDNNTNANGDFDQWVILDNTTGPDGHHLFRGNEVSYVQALNVYTDDGMTGNSTVYLVPERGFTIITDIDDNDPFEQMPLVYQKWAAEYQDLHFHYFTTTPKQLTRNYVNFSQGYYPLGSFDSRPLDVWDPDTMTYRRELLDRMIQTFPQRKFILVGDSANADAMTVYPKIAKDYPGKVQCILIRNTSATDCNTPSYTTSDFIGLEPRQVMFFVGPQDVLNINFTHGDCYSSGVDPPPNNSPLVFPVKPCPSDEGVAASFGISVSFLLSVVGLLLLV